MKSLRETEPIALLKSGLRLLNKPLVLAAQETLGTITSVKTSDPVVALTFDDGPHPRYTRRLLEILKKYHVHGTFFMVGELAHRYPDVVRSIAEGGHVIGNHSWSHASFHLLTTLERRDQIRACEEALHPYGKKFFRPPYHHQSVASRFEAVCMGYSVVGFSAHAEDWLERKSDWIAAQLVKQIKPGSIVILHDNICHSTEQIPQYDRKPMLEGLRMALERLGKKFQFVTIPELLLHGRPQKCNWFSRPDARMIDTLTQYPAVTATEMDLGIKLNERRR